MWSDLGGTTGGTGISLIWKMRTDMLMKKHFKKIPYQKNKLIKCVIVLMIQWADTSNPSLFFTLFIVICNKIPLKKKKKMEIPRPLLQFYLLDFQAELLIIIIIISQATLITKTNQTLGEASKLNPTNTNLCQTRNNKRRERKQKEMPETYFGIEHFWLLSISKRPRQQ